MLILIFLSIATEPFVAETSHFMHICIYVMFICKLVITTVTYILIWPPYMFFILFMSIATELCVTETPNLYKDAFKWHAYG